MSKENTKFGRKKKLIFFWDKENRNSKNKMKEPNGRHRIACQVALFADASSSAKDATSGRHKKEESRIHDAVMVTPAVYQRSFNQKRHPHGGLFRSIKLPVIRRLT